MQTLENLINQYEINPIDINELSFVKSNKKYIIYQTKKYYVKSTEIINSGYKSIASKINIYNLMRELYISKKLLQNNKLNIQNIIGYYKYIENAKQYFAIVSTKIKGKPLKEIINTNISKTKLYSIIASIIILLKDLNKINNFTNNYLDISNVYIGISYNDFYPVLLDFNNSYMDNIPGLYIAGEYYNQEKMNIDMDTKKLLLSISQYHNIEDLIDKNDTEHILKYILDNYNIINNT